ncbi:hypothetical protein EYV94_13395 [Puteibacter caeruleilacunae]|nr:hypothetical protein EYV94_13395 [Puteibacter caeruleilacunae]
MNMNIKDKLYQLFSIRWVQHVLFWSVFLFLSISRLLSKDESNFQQEFFFEVSQMAFIALFVYFNLLFLIPRYWNKGQYVKYCANIVFWELVFVSILSFTLTYYPDVIFKNIANKNFNRLIVINAFKLNIFVLSSTLFHFVKEWIALKDENLRFTEKAQEQLEAELSFLKGQVNPHFLFNTLNNIYSMSLYDSNKTPDMILKLSELISYMLYECRDNEVSLQKEINCIKNYIELEAVRVEDVAQINFQVKGNDPGHMVPPLLFIPLIENAFKHGISPELERSDLNITIEISSNELRLKIVNPIKYDDSSRAKNGGLGIINVKKRLELLYPEMHLFTVTEENNLYSTLLVLTLK